MPPTTQLEMWKERIHSGQKFQQQFAQMQDWQRYKDYYRHKNFAPGSMPVNLMFSILRSLVPQVYYRNPKVTLTARKPGLEAELNARLVQRIDNWLLKELSAKREFKRLIADNFFCGTGSGIIGYDSLYGFDTDLTNQTGMFTLSQFDTSGKRIEFNASVNPGMPWFLRARPEDVVFPWGTTSFESAEWFALRVFRKVADIRKDKKYSNTQGVSGTIVPKRTMPEGGEIADINQYGAVDTDDQWVELWEIHDARSGKVMAFTADHNKWLRQDDDELQIEGLPIEGAVFNPDPDYIYGVPDARIIEPQLLELTDIRTQAMKHRRIDVLKALIRKDLLSDEEISKLTSENVQALISVDTEAASLRDVVMPLNPGASGILSDLAAQGEITREDIREAVGFSRTASGQFQGKTHISATETQRVFQSLNIRLDERRDEMAELVSRTVRKWNQIIFKHWTQERVADIIGPDGAQWWLKFSGPQLADEYDLDVVASEGPLMDTETKKELAIQAANAYAKLNAGAISQGAPIPAEIQRLIFSQFEETGLDIDRLLAQTGATGQQGLQSQMGGMGGSPQQALSPAMLAQVANAQRGGQ